MQLTLPALERLLGGETEAEIGLRTQIVTEFANRHLKTIASEETMRVAIEEVKTYAQGLVKETFDVEAIFHSHVWPKITAKLRAIMDEYAKVQAQRAVDEALAKVIEHQQRYWRNEVIRLVETSTERGIDKIVDERIQQRLEAVRTLIPSLPAPPAQADA